MHLDESTLERALHDELDRDALASVERHLAACTVCADRLVDAERSERELFGLLEELDHETPRLDWKAVLAADTPEDTRRETRVERDTGRTLLAASLAFLLVATAVLAAIPGTPVRGWLESVLGQGPRSDPAAADGDRMSRSGVAVVPDDPFEVAFAAGQPSGRIHVTFVPSSRVELTVTGEPVELESGTDRLVVANRGSSASYELRVPRNLESIRITVDGETIIEKRGGMIQAPAPPEADGEYILDLEIVRGR